MDKWVTLIMLLVEILSGVAVCIPLVVKLVDYVQQASKEKNWNKIVEAVLKLMVEAEKQFVEGAAKKVWVMSEVKVLANSINYDYDEVAEQKISVMIDAMCDASKVLNTKTAEKK